MKWVFFLFFACRLGEHAKLKFGRRGSTVFYFFVRRNGGVRGEGCERERERERGREEEKEFVVL
jgi:hypothetical protein